MLGTHREQPIKDLQINQDWDDYLWVFHEKEHKEHMENQCQVNIYR